MRPCALATLPAKPTAGDLDAAYLLRGAQIVACDGARRLAVETLLAERAMQDAGATPRLTPCKNDSATSAAWCAGLPGRLANRRDKFNEISVDVWLTSPFGLAPPLLS
ncbi:hypothetical protein [uncultured Brevundimonas sp.]|uniref:hypothetical protein n=1 Tax=uncultured Brevundimonas sp. TaxID=213418 RepID=UPI002600F6EC|nr:hypothetical protein [uncultured Brevundimonas sp.]